MESITNAATAATNAAASLLGYGTTSTTATQEHESGQEPVSGLKGEGTVAEPYDSGNKVDDPVLGGESHQKTSTTGASTLGSSTLGSSSTTGESTLGSSTHPTSSSITDATSSTTSGGLPTTGLSGRTARETAEFVAAAPIQGEAGSTAPLSSLNSTSGIDTTYHQHNDATTNVNAVTSGSVAPIKDSTTTSAVTTKDTTSPIASTGVTSLDKSHGVDSTSHSSSLAPNVAAAGGAGTTTASPATPVKSSTSSATGTSGVSGTEEHGSGKKKLSDKIKEKLHIGSENKKH